MTKDPRLYLDDILESCNRIEIYIENIDKKKFDDNDLLKDAVVTRLLVIGEAINRLPEEFISTHQDIQWSEPVKMRNLLIHHYDDIKYDLVWSTISKDLPPFKQQVEALLKELDS